MNRYNNRTNKRHTKQVPKFSQRRDNLVGLKNKPLSKKEKNGQVAQLSRKLENFNKHLKAWRGEVNKRLGYYINTEYCAPKELKLKDILLKNEKNPQRFSIPLEPKIVEEFINADKFVIKKVNSTLKGEKAQHEKEQYLCVAMLEKGPVLFDFYTHFKYPYGKYSEDNYNIGIYALLHGQDYFHINRYDNLSLTGHTQLLDENGHVIMKYVSKDRYANKAHTHPYDIRHAVLLPGKEHVGHDDRILEYKYADFSCAVRAWKKKFHIRELNLEFDEESTLEEICEQIKDFDNNKKSGKVSNGGEQCNLKNSQQNWNNQSKSKE